MCPHFSLFIHICVCSAVIVTQRHQSKSLLASKDEFIVTEPVRFSCKMLLGAYNLLAFVASFLFVYIDLGSAEVRIG